MVKSSAKKKVTNDRVISIDWTDVESGGGSKLIPEGGYEVKIIEVEKKTSDNSGEDYLSWTLEVVSPEEHAGVKLYYNTSLQQKSLWNLRGVLEVLGFEIPEGPDDIDLDDLIDRTAGVEVQRGDYNGKPKNEVIDFFEFKDESASKKPSKKVKEEEDEEEEKPAKKTSKKAAAKKYNEDELLEKDEEELQELNDKHELDIDLDEFNTLRRKRAAIIESLEEKGLVDVA